MSDTDDTDLLLLIPPDFFLVHSPDIENFDSNSDISYSHNHAELKDSIVSDLITQVNDLESRICLIENLERTSTRCSTFNDDSFNNQSINSLTESDILRAHIKDKQNLLTRVQPSLMVKTNEDFESCIDETLSKQFALSLSNGSVSLPHKQTNLADSDGSADHEHEKVTQRPIERQCFENQQNIVLGPQLSKEKQSQLLNEVDTYLERKTLGGSATTDLFKIRKLNQSDKEAVGDNVLSQDDSKLNPHFEFKEHRPSDKYVDSLALNEVYKLIAEMEETQSEMQKKLKSTAPILHFKSNFNKADDPKIIGEEGLNTNSVKPVFNKQAGSIMEKLKKSQGNSFDSSDSYKHRPNNNQQTNYLSLQNPSEYEISHSKTLKPRSLSASRYSSDNNPIDVVKANLPRKDDRNFLFTGDKGSPNRNSSFRKQLHFDKPHSPLRTPKTKSSLSLEQRKGIQTENQGNDDNDKSMFNTLLHQSGCRTPHSLEEKYNVLSAQRNTGVNWKNHSDQYGLSKKSSGNDVIQQKISSNNLLSLSELWNKEPTFYSDDPSKLRQKLEEEKYRRQHCEQQIQVLQLRVLEEQEKLAVAIKVDQEKDKAIMQITESWRRLNDHWSELEEQRHSLAQQLQTEKEISKTHNLELTKKIERWEKEVSQALDLAAGYKEKSECVQEQMESLKSDTEEKLKEADAHLNNLNEKNSKLCNENKNLSQQLDVLQQRIKEEEELLSKMKVELEKSRKRLLEFEAENSVLKEQNASLTSGVKEDRNRISILEQKISSLQQALNEICKKEKAAQEELRVSNERMEVTRTELRALYQGQLETVVKEKLQEFQGQLETAEAALKAELHAKEKQWAEKANDQYHQLHNKYKRDLQRIEESHKEEINIWKEKLKECEKMRLSMEKKLQEEANRRADIAQRLHNVMETQWREALNIISNPLQGVYEIPKDGDKNNWSPRQQNPERLQGKGDVRISRSNSVTSLVQGDDAPFCREGLVTYRTSQPAQDHQLKKYIQMLLERGPGNPLQDSMSQDNPDQIFSQESNSLFNKWITNEVKRTNGQSDRENQSHKPPWR